VASIRGAEHLCQLCRPIRRPAQATADAALALYLTGNDHAVEDLSNRAIARGLDPDAVQLCLQNAQERAADRELRRKADLNIFQREVNRHNAREPEQSDPGPLEWSDMSTWDAEPAPQPEYTVPGRIPKRQCMLFSGEGGGGKTTIGAQLAAGHVLGRDWLGSLPEPGPAWILEVEDEESVMRWRLERIFYLTSANPKEGEQPDQELREIRFMKNQYGKCDDSIVLRWDRGIFRPLEGQTTLQKAAQEGKADDVFLAFGPF
jgi:hypothetical protein